MVRNSLEGIPSLGNAGIFSYSYSDPERKIESACFSV